MKAYAYADSSKPQVMPTLVVTIRASLRFNLISSRYPGLPRSGQPSSAFTALQSHESFAARSCLFSSCPKALTSSLSWNSCSCLSIQSRSLCLTTVSGGVAPRRLEGSIGLARMGTSKARISLSAGSSAASRTWLVTIKAHQRHAARRDMSSWYETSKLLRFFDQGHHLRPGHGTLVHGEDSVHFEIGAPYGLRDFVHQF